MAKRKLSSLVQAMNLFNEMDARDRITLSDYIRSQTTTQRKAIDPKPAPSAARKSSQKSEKASTTASTEGEKESVSDASIMCAICGHVEAFLDHDRSSDSYHKFRTSLKSKGNKSNGADDVVLPDNPDDYVHGAKA